MVRNRTVIRFLLGLTLSIVMVCALSSLVGGANGQAGVGCYRNFTGPASEFNTDNGHSMTLGWPLTLLMINRPVGCEEPLPIYIVVHWDGFALYSLIGAAIYSVGFWAYRRARRPLQ